MCGERKTTDGSFKFKLLINFFKIKNDVIRRPNLKFTVCCAVSDRLNTNLFCYVSRALFFHEAFQKKQNISPSFEFKFCRAQARGTLAESSFLFMRVTFHDQYLPFSLRSKTTAVQLRVQSMLFFFFKGTL